MDRPKRKVWISGGEEIVVETARRPGWTEAEWTAEHDAAVALWMEEFPED